MANKDVLFSAFGPNADLTEAINRLAVPNLPLVTELQLFKESGITSTSAVIDYEDETVTFVPTAPRGGVPEPYNGGARQGLTVNAVHVPQQSSVWADEAQDMRAHGVAESESPESLQKKRLGGMKKNIEHTLGYHRVGALKGLILDADGSVLLDVFAAFGTTQQTQIMGFGPGAGTYKVLQKTIDAQRKSEDALGGDRPQGYLALAAPDFMDAMRGSSDYSTLMERATPSEMLRDYRSGITVADSTFIELRTPPGAPTFIEAGSAYLIPLGIEGLLISRFAPANYNETVNTDGLPFYAKSQPKDFDKGYDLEAQSNWFNLCTRPRSIIKLTMS